MRALWRTKLLADAQEYPKEFVNVFLVSTHHYVWFSRFWSHFRRTNALFASKAKINVVLNFFEWRGPEGYPEISNNVDFSLWGKQCICPAKMRPKSWKTDTVICHVNWRWYSFLNMTFVILVSCNILEFLTAKYCDHFVIFLLWIKWPSICKEDDLGINHVKVSCDFKK